MQNNGLDKDGFILSEVDITNILPEYDLAIKDSLSKIKEVLPGIVHSAYVYGSVARGNAVHGKSDLDLLLIFTRKLEPEERTKLNTTLESLSKNYSALVREVGVADCTIDAMLNPANEYGWGAYLKILCVCVDGDDVTKQLPRFKLTSEIAIGFNGDISSSIDAAIQKLKHAGSNEEVGKIASTLARKLIRTCYSMVMTRAQLWTTKLDEQAKYFVEFFPNKSGFIHTLESWIANPPHDRKNILNVLQMDGEWLTENFEKEATRSTI